jgi:DMSO reductase iron-sulfur subunit
MDIFDRTDMLDKTTDQPDYVRLRNVPAPESNRYGKRITLVEEGSALATQALRINGRETAATSPNRHKQHGFYFTADNCIACHACESACSEKNDLPAHLAFRSVGYVEGGTWPDYQRLNLSMACNHCDDPVCLKGCPTRAYTKFAEYGAVLQDPDICFGCGYCTWVCPYNAPQLDPVAGHVQKCNMCVDRLEAGLKPACASACLAGALDFGVIETRPEKRDQLETVIPGFPDPGITHPNIRFQQTRTLPRELTRPDAMPLRYERDAHGDGKYKTKVRANSEKREWNLKQLRSREDPLVVFTLVSQMVIGAFLVLFLGAQLDLPVLTAARDGWMHSALLFGLLGAQTLALALSTMHLGKPHRFYRAFNNLRYSPVSREVAGIAVFYALLAGYAGLTAFPFLFAWLPAGLVSAITAACGWGATLAGPVALYFMHAIYRIPARPFWNHWQVLTSFYGSMLTLGGLVAGLVSALALWWTQSPYIPLLQVLAWPVVAGLVLEGIGLALHARDLKLQGGEGAASHYRQTTAYGKAYVARNIGFGLSALVVTTLAVSGLAGGWVLGLWGLAALAITALAVMGRALFYVLVIPTTMPGAFFWHNKGFETHARETGLAQWPQVGVVPDSH